jgi:predicted N-acetyltransferase YhbS
MIAIQHETPGDVAGREALLDVVLGECRFTKTSARLRGRRLPADGLAFVASERRRVIGSVRLWEISAGPGRPALLLGPLAVAADRRDRGVGAALVRRALHEAASRGHAAVLLVGDAPYYGRFGFSTEKTGALWLPGPFERHRLLGHELLPHALGGAHGLISAIGRREPTPDLAALISNLHYDASTLAPRAA